MTPPRKLDYDLVRAMYDGGESVAAIARDMHCATPSIRRIIDPSYDQRTYAFNAARVASCDLCHARIARSSVYGARSRGNAVVRCWDCYAAERAARPIQHGTETGYARCSCDDCRAAASAARRARRQRKAAAQ